MGADIDKKSLLSAEANIASNGLQEQITLWTSKPNEKILAPIFMVHLTSGQIIVRLIVSGNFERTKPVLDSLPAVRWTQAAQVDANQPITITASATANCWSRAARRRAVTFSNEGPPVLTCQFAVTSEADSKTNLHCQWVRGRERDLFESFWSHVSRKVADK
ncbi:hypothetical protein FRC05_007561 [Tulasnella sp. 425]|nr:hypothetical protein FRC05_007561 [Tulasnella sp. 425]